MRPHAAVSANFESNTGLQRQHEKIVEALLTDRGNPSGDVERMLADDPQSVTAYCLRAALIVRADDTSARSKLAESVAAIEANCIGIDDPARRHASAARAWLESDQALAVERYDVILVDFPRDILALAVTHARRLVDARAPHRA